MTQTRQCVRCKKRKATQWSGHVLRGNTAIIAGWCAVCMQYKGFVGHYKAWMKAVG